MDEESTGTLAREEGIFVSFSKWKSWNSFQIFKYFRPKFGTNVQKADPEMFSFWVNSIFAKK